jgi:hypothetical protein
MGHPCTGEDAPDTSSEGTPHIQFEETTYDFGQVKEGIQVIHIFTFKNVGTATLVLGKIRTSCGCTAAVVSEQEIPPGGQGEIKVTFDTKNRRGKSHKTITVSSNDPDQPNMQLSISGEILVDVDITPHYVNFGNIKRGEEHTKSVKVRFPHDPTLRVTRVESLTEGITAKQGATKSDETEIQIRVDRKAPVGRLSGRVKIHTTSPNKPTDVIMVVVHVMGEIMVEPSSLSGVFLKGNPKTLRSIDLTKKGEKNLKIEKVEENTGRFTTNVAEVKKGEHYRIELSLREDAELGSFRGTLRIYTNHTDQRVIEVRLSGSIKE